MLHAAPKTIQKTTLNLVPGDLILTGDMFDGFWHYTIVEVKPSQHNKRMALVTVRFDHGGTVTTVEGKNTRWFVIQ